MFLPLPTTTDNVLPAPADVGELPPIYGENFILLDPSFLGVPPRNECAPRAYTLQAVITYCFLRLFEAAPTWLVAGMALYVAGT